MDLWLPLSEYSNKYKVSVSTLRRKIKADEIKYRFEDGKYLISDESVVEDQGARRPSPKSEATLTSITDKEKNEPILTAANKILNELKRAYTQILQEKEEQITQLREEVADLKTLVRVLESENLKLNAKNRN